MAQLLTPVHADPFKLQKPVHTFNANSSRNRWNVHSTRFHKWRVVGQNRKTGHTRVKAVADDSATVVDEFADDYYAVLGLVISLFKISFTLLEYSFLYIYIYIF